MQLYRPNSKFLLFPWPNILGIDYIQNEVKLLLQDYKAFVQTQLAPVPATLHGLGGLRSEDKVKFDAKICQALELKHRTWRWKSDPTVTNDQQLREIGILRKKRQPPDQKEGPKPKKIKAEPL